MAAIIGFGEFSIVVVGLTVVILGGGIDLSVGSIFALATFAAVGSFLILGWPVWAALAAAIATGLVFGSINGLLIGYFDEDYDLGGQVEGRDETLWYDNLFVRSPFSWDMTQP